MPLVKVFTSVEPKSPEAAEAWLEELSRTVAEQLGKPERWVMTCLLPKTTMTFGGTGAPACYVEVKSIGKLTPSTTKALSAEICKLTKKALGVPPDRTYIEFADAQPHLWGYDGGTF